MNHKKKKRRYEVILAGSGGQGLVVAGILLAEAAMLEKKNVVQTASYGIASRGGFSMAEVIVDDSEILFQQVLQADVALVLTQEAMEKIHGVVTPATQLFYDADLVTAEKGKGRYGFPFTQKARELGNSGVANIIALGVISMHTGMVRIESLARVIQERYKGQIRELNGKALREGMNLDAGGSFAE